MACVVVGGPGDDLQVRRGHGGRTRQGHCLLDIEALADEHRPEAEFLGTRALGDQVAWVLRPSRERVEAELRKARCRGHTANAAGVRERMKHRGAHECVGRLGHHPRERLVHVPHAVGEVEGHVDAGLTGPVGESGRVRQQHFVHPGLDQHRRQAGEVGEERRHARVVERNVAGVDASCLGDLGAVDHRIGSGPGDHGLARAGEVGPRRHQVRRRRQRVAGLAERHEGRQRRTAAGRVAGDRHDRRIDVGDQRTVRRHTVVDRCRIHVFGCEPVLDHGGRGRRSPRQVGDHRDVALG